MLDDFVDEVLRDNTGYGIFDYSKYPNITATTVFSDQIAYVDNQIQRIWRDHVMRASCPPIASAINADPSVNAIAIPGNDQSFISLNAGTLVRIRQMFMFAACDEDAFFRVEEDDVIDPGKQDYGLEAIEILKPVDLALKGQSHAEDDYIHLFGPVPHTHSRFGLANSLTIAAIDFVSMHEFAHIARNHCGLMPYPPRSFREVSLSADVPGNENQLGQLCEIDADLVGGKLSMLKFTSTDTLTTLWNGWATDPRESLRLWIVAVMMTIMLFDGWSLKFGTGTHPHPQLSPHFFEGRNATGGRRLAATVLV